MNGKSVYRQLTHLLNKYLLSIYHVPDTAIGVTIYCSGNIYYLLVRQEKKGVTEDEMVGWHHKLNGYKSEQTPGDSGGQRSLACCSPGVEKSQT